MQASDKERTATLWECDHMRLIVQDEDGEWRHLEDKGRIGGVCGASSVYQVNATITGRHTLDRHYRAIHGT